MFLVHLFHPHPRRVANPSYHCFSDGLVVQPPTSDGFTTPRKCLGYIEERPAREALKGLGDGPFGAQTDFIYRIKIVFNNATIR